MKANASNIWSVPAFLPYLQPALTAQAVADAEARLDVTLPQEYLDLLYAQNGGYIRFHVLNALTGSRLIYGIGPFFPSVTESILAEYTSHGYDSLEGLIPFDGDGHTFICFNYKDGSSNPSIIDIDLECDSQQVLANSFADYLDKLKFSISADDFIIPSVSSIEDTITKLEKTLGVSFDPPTSVAHGYPEYRARLPKQSEKSNRPDWVWISPNLVEKCFARKYDMRLAELQAAMSGHELRYPMLPKKCYVVRFTPTSQSTIIRAFEEAGIELSPTTSLAPELFNK